MRLPWWRRFNSIFHGSLTTAKSRCLRNQDSGLQIWIQNVREREKSNNMVRERMGVKWEMEIVVCMNSPHYMQDLHAKISHSPMLIPQPNMLIQKRNVTTLSCNTIILITYNHLLLLFHKLLTVILNQFRIKLNAYWELCYIFFFSFYNLFLLYFAVERK